MIGVYEIVGVANGEKKYFCGYNRKNESEPILLRNDQLYSKTKEYRTVPKLYAGRLKAERAMLHLQTTRGFLPGYLRLDNIQKSNGVQM